MNHISEFLKLFIEQIADAPEVRQPFAPNASTADTRRRARSTSKKARATGGRTGKSKALLAEKLARKALPGGRVDIRSRLFLPTQAKFLPSPTGEVPDE